MIVRRTEIKKVATYKVGDVIEFTLACREKVEAMAVKEDENGMLFCFVDCLISEECMNREDTNRGGYDASDLRVKLNAEILDCFPAEIREQMIPFENGDYLRLPTEKEIFGENEDGTDEPDIEQWAPMKYRKNRIALYGRNGICQWYWLQNSAVASAASFAVCGHYGFASYASASSSLGVRPVFMLRQI